MYQTIAIALLLLLTCFRSSTRYVGTALRPRQRRFCLAGRSRGQSRCAHHTQCLANPAAAYCVMCPLHCDGIAYAAIARPRNRQRDRHELVVVGQSSRPRNRPSCSMFLNAFVWHRFPYSCSTFLIPDFRRPFLSWQTMTSSLWFHNNAVRSGTMLPHRPGIGAICLGGVDVDDVLERRRHFRCTVVNREKNGCLDLLRVCE